MKRVTHYAVLNIAPDAGDGDVRRAYRALALRWHPDRNPGNREQARRMFVLVHQSYEMLRTKPQREAYNRYLARQSLPTSSTHHRRKSSRTGTFIRALYEIFWPVTFRKGESYGG